MTTTFKELRSDELFEAANSVWQTVLGFSLQRQGPPSNNEAGATFYTAWVGMSDVQHYAIYAVSDRAHICHAAAIMFDKNPERIDETDLRDALGELVNQIAGALINQNVLRSETGLPHIRAQGDNLPFCQQLICATEAWCNQHHIYFAVCRYNGEWIVPEC